MIVLGAPSNVTGWEGLWEFIAFKMSNCEMGGNKKSHWTIDHNDSRWRSNQTGTVLQKLQLPVQV